MTDLHCAGDPGQRTKSPRPGTLPFVNKGKEKKVDL